MTDDKTKALGRFALEALKKAADERCQDADKLWGDACQKWRDMMDDNPDDSLGVEKAGQAADTLRAAFKFACQISEGFHAAQKFEHEFDKEMSAYEKLNAEFEAYRKEKKND